MELTVTSPHKLHSNLLTLVIGQGLHFILATVSPRCENHSTV
uniref:Uncharacterized protein n=1 Tax=Rhizophora mucronata TaxID=61149 RepID=A0A2P2PJK8_RHIMU